MFGDMKGKCIGVIVFLLSFCMLGCGNRTNVTYYSDTLNTDMSAEKNNTEDKAVPTNAISEIEGGDSIGEGENEYEAVNGDIYSDEASYEEAKECMQKLIDEAYSGLNQAVEINGGYYGETEFEECRNFEKNMVLDFCGVKKWNSPTFAQDEYFPDEEEHDEPLGVYEYEETYGDYDINHYYGGYNFKQDRMLHIISLLKQKEGDSLVGIRMYFMEKGAAGLMTFESCHDYRLPLSFKEYSTKGVFDKYLNDDDTQVWYWFDGENMSFICDMNRVEKKNSEGKYCGYTYEYSVLANCVNSNGNYIVDEVIPLKMQ